MKKRIVSFIILWYAIYLVLSAVIEPLGWFSGQTMMQKLGVLPNILLLVIPAIITIAYYFLYTQKGKKYLGVSKFSTGIGRDEAFQNIRANAKNKIFVVGIGMSNISKYGKQSIDKQSGNVDIDFLMIDPDYLDANNIFAKQLEDFLGIKNFSTVVRTSYEELKEICENNNKKISNRRLRLRVYNTIPTASMVMIDPDEKDGECVVEFFLFRSGENRPRLECKNINEKDNLFSILKDKYLSLWHHSKTIVE